MPFCVKKLTPLRDCHQISLQILSQFEQIDKIISPLKQKEVEEVEDKGNIS